MENYLLHHKPYPISRSVQYEVNQVIYVVVSSVPSLAELSSFTSH